MKYLLTAIFLAFSFCIFRACQTGTEAFDQAIQLNTQNDSLQMVVELQRIEIERAKDMAEMYRRDAQVKLKEIIQYRTITREIRVHDTLNQRFTDSTYCHTLEQENDGLWQVHTLDSATIVHYEAGLNKCDSLVTTLNDAWNQEAKARWKAEAKANKEAFMKTTWKMVSAILSAVTTGLIVSR